MSFKDWFRKRTPKDAQPLPAAPDYPWDQHPSIYEHIQAHVQAGVRGLAEGGEELPDEESPSSGKIRWSAGALDGVLSHHMSGSSEDASTMVAKIRDYCQAPTALNKLFVYEAAKTDSVLGIIDTVITELGKIEGLDLQRLYDLSRSFVLEAHDRGPVKVGIALMGRFRQPDDVEVFRTLGRHEEFTLYCAVALANCVEDPESELWELARQVSGWGRIHLVERLAETTHPQTKDWMLREGFRNAVMNEYLAYTCATAGELLNALRADHVDDELLAATGEILDALIAGGPARDIRWYQEGGEVVERYLDLLTPRTSRLAEYLTVKSIADAVNGFDKWEERRDFGWTEERCEQIRRRCGEILGQEKWRAQAQRELLASDEHQFFTASRAAESIGIDIWPVCWKRLQEAPADFGRWFEIMRLSDAARIVDVLAFAEKVTLGRNADEVAKEDNAFPVPTPLEAVLGQLGRFPGFGGKLIEKALAHPASRTRNTALRVLDQWGRDRWPTGVEPHLTAAAARESDEKMAGEMRRVLAGQPAEAEGS